MSAFFGDPLLQLLFLLLVFPPALKDYAIRAGHCGDRRVPRYHHSSAR